MRQAWSALSPLAGVLTDLVDRIEAIDQITGDEATGGATPDDAWDADDI